MAEPGSIPTNQAPEKQTTSLEVQPAKTSEPAKKETEAERSEERETGRLEAFSDGVFAIAITLLILEIKLPPLQNDELALLRTLGQQWPAFLSYVISFLTILIMWINHHTIFKLIRRTDHVFLFLNGLLLMFVTFVNYPTALLAEYIETPAERVAAAVYSGTFVVIAILYNLLWRYASHQQRLLSRSASHKLAETITRQYQLGPVYYLLAFVLAFVSVPASIFVNALLAIYFAFTGRLNNKPAKR